MKTPHIHAAVIKAWADGATIQINAGCAGWIDIKNNDPAWESHWEYRVKPEPKPDIRVIGYITLYRDQSQHHPTYKDSLSRFVSDIAVCFDGETGNLKEVKLINNA